MTAANPDRPPDADRPIPTVAVGGLKVTGPLALVVLVALVAGLVALLVFLRPSWPILTSGLLWLAFTVYWSAGAKQSAPTKNAESGGSRQIHELMMNGALLLLFVPVPGLTTRWWPASTLVVTCGLGVQVACLLLAVWARRHLGRNWSARIRVAVDHQLVRTGPYRRVRHPIYTAMLGMCLGTSIVSGETHALIGLGLMSVAYWRKIRLEEARLRDAFGAEYESYVRASFKLVPWLW